MEGFQDKVAVVTGAGSGIGRALAEELSQRGARVVLADVNHQRLGELAESISRSGYAAASVVLDVSDFEGVRGLMQETMDSHGRLDYVFNNAGIAVAGEVQNCTIEDWRRVLEVNLSGVVNGVAVAYPLMVQQGFGHIVNTASIDGLIPFPGAVSYVASKYGVVGLSNALRIEGRDLGVKVSVVCPGYIQTAIFHDMKVIQMDRDQIFQSLSKIKGMSPKACASVILRGVQRNKAIIMVTRLAKVFWMLQRISPALMRGLLLWKLREFR
jgi:NADP-dependent 3-hydroxy acid dehydrogenase YdfG